MAISPAYKQKLKERAIAAFIKENSRTPTDAELIDLVLREYKRYPSVDEVGISGFDIERPQFQEASSAVQENANRVALFDDLTTVAKRIDNLNLLLDDSFRGFKGTVRRTKHSLSQIEARLDNLLLLNGNVDAFVYGTEETFDLQDKIDFTKTTASVESGYVTLGRNGYSTLDLAEVSISYSTTSEKGYIGTQNTSPIDFLKEDDGTLWEHLVYTKQRSGRVSVTVELDLITPTYVGDVRFTGGNIGVNQHTTATMLYSLDGQTFSALEPAEIALTGDEYQFNIGLEGVHKVRLMLSKGVSDNVTTTSGQYVYVFNLDSLKIFTDTYGAGAVSELRAGPYSIVNELGDPIYFTKATCSACVITDEDSSVSFFLSKDNVSWSPVDVKGNGLNYVSFASGTKEGSYDVVDTALEAGALIDEIAGFEDIDLTYEAALNIFVPEAFVDDLSLRNIVIKRNIVGAIQTEDIYQAPPGWYFDSNTSQYTTTIYVDATEGRLFDLGPTGAYVNGNLLAGEVLLRKGYTVFATSDSNWQAITDDITTLSALKRADPLYPYNHKHMVEGYAYPDSYTAERIYNGVDEYFGRLLQYVPPEQFNADDWDTDLGIYTVDNPSGNMYFRVKVDRTDASWLNEEFDVDWLVHSDTSNSIYVKAILSASDSAQTPVIENFKVRVI